MNPVNDFNEIMGIIVDNKWNYALRTWHIDIYKDDKLIGKAHFEDIGFKGFTVAKCYSSEIATVFLLHGYEIDVTNTLDTNSTNCKDLQHARGDD